MRWHLPECSNQDAICVYLIVFEDEGQVDGNVLKFGGDDDPKAIPGHAVVSLVSLLCPTAI